MATVKPNTVPTVFCLNPANHRKYSQVKEARALPCSIIEDLLKLPSPEPYSSKEQEAATRDIRIQFG